MSNHIDKIDNAIRKLEYLKYVLSLEEASGLKDECASLLAHAISNIDSVRVDLSLNTEQFLV